MGPVIYEFCVVPLYGQSVLFYDVAILNTLRRKRNEQHFVDDILKRIFFDENAWISIKILTEICSQGSH